MTAGSSIRKLKEIPISIFIWVGTASFCIDVAFNESDAAEKYLLVIEQDLSSDFTDYDGLSDSNLFPVNLACKPRFNYYNNHCLFKFVVRV